MELEIEVMHCASKFGKDIQLGMASIVLNHVHYFEPTNVFTSPLILKSEKAREMIHFTITIKPCLKPYLKKAISKSNTTMPHSIPPLTYQNWISYFHDSKNHKLSRFSYTR